MSARRRFAALACLTLGACPTIPRPPTRGAGPISVCAAGDLQLGSHSTEATVATLPQLLTAQLRFVNLEGPLTDNGAEAGLDADGVPRAPIVRFRGPPQDARWLAGRVDVVSLANNHGLDQGREGLRDSEEALGKAGVRAATAEHDAAVSVDGRAVTVIARDFTDALPDERGEHALLEHVAAAARQSAVLVSLHWGRTGSYLPSEQQRELAQELIDHGATAVLGHGPHALQGIERHGRGVIAYSLGNLGFSCRCTDVEDAYVLRFAIDETGAATRVLAVPIRAGLQRAPTLAHDAELGALIAQLSQDLGSDARATEAGVEIR